MWIFRFLVDFQPFYILIVSSVCQIWQPPRNIEFSTKIYSQVKHYSFLIWLNKIYNQNHGYITEYNTGFKKGRNVKLNFANKTTKMKTIISMECSIIIIIFHLRISEENYRKPFTKILIQDYDKHLCTDKHLSIVIIIDEEKMRRLGTNIQIPIYSSWHPV